MKKYKHFKGEIYEVLFEAINSENKEKMVVYKDQSGEIYVRPASMFYGKVEVNGKFIPRFEEID
ncbi:DUF1653 domain-containing protein [Oceanobacillus caeni]|uniref:DUF1653 domain-containing protein n=1 Tax=Oceanobacillus caeni TaxID=405946 RepID=A0ABR5MK31_9BACI|nr:DUF1653 domain-containing protein [Oceanobacillus caeni]KPH76062.1 hypothetical protein AFL42_07070 [Oceanobacillus caeni]